MAFELDCKYFPYYILLIIVIISLYYPEKFAFIYNPCAMLIVISSIAYCIMNKNHTLCIAALTVIMFVSCRYQNKMFEDLKSVSEKFEQFDPSSESTLN